MTKEEDGKTRLAGWGSNAQKMLGNVTGTVTGTVTGLVQTVRNKNSQGPTENHEILLKTEMEFHQAAKTNNVDKMTQLKGRKVNINAKNALDRTALHFAVAGCHYQAISFLLGNKARVDVADKHGLTVLHLASWSADVSVMQMLIKAGASQKATNQDGMNVLHFAAQNDKNEIVDYLLKELQLQDLVTKDKRGREPFHLAAENGHINMINNLLNMGIFTSEPDKDGNTALHMAAANGHDAVIRVLLEKWEDKDKDCLNSNGATPFYLAVEGGHESCANQLLEHGSNINTITYDDYTALHIAAEKGHTSLVTFLIRNNIDMTPKPNDRIPPIHLAIMNDHIEIVDVFMEAGYDINAINGRQQTPLHLAAELKNTDLVERLLIAGCDLRIEDKQGKTALGVAERSNHTLIADMIIKAERYNTCKKGLIEDISCEEFMTFKQDHSLQTSHVRSALWSLAYEQLKPDEWKTLAILWMFTEPQIKAIETQWTGKASYKEHGHRMLLIWLHGILLRKENPIKALYEELVRMGHQQMAETFRAQCSDGVQTKKSLSLLSSVEAFHILEGAPASGHTISKRHYIQR
ncbi:PREDICTED: ankyrin repeat and death domain-containing protein 1B [Nanorana parkeri]|uniref:ankyrin repeat and death domain-containing protein 1B n=1 Tax=Nanorana parkeri TaxID=125878 RepID=UPI0008542392|nr:PREDICTED: ankyrin repeat and death domain-containing protein 1B [Nanorana parkeri]